MNDWRTRAKRLARDLADHGVLTDPRWRAAFEAVPRHAFVPRFYGENGAIVDGGDPGQRDAWLSTVYTDSTLVTQIAAVPGTELRWSTSSSTMPSLMARMFQLLDVTDDDRVLEIGTGSGYNAALLCHRLSDAQVASIDLDPELVADARRRLAALGHRPRLVAGDGAAGIPDAAPYQRIIATCAVREVPLAWITQLAPDGLILADVRGEIAGSLVVLRRSESHTVGGRFLGLPGHFMWMRAEAGNPLRDAGTYRTTFSLDGARHRATDLDPAAFDEPNLRFFLQLLVPDIEAMYRTRNHGTGVMHLRSDDGCWAEVGTTAEGERHRVTEAGTRSLWTAAERAARLWVHHGRPACTRFGLTCTVDGGQHFWLDDPSTAVELLG